MDLPRQNMSKLFSKAKSEKSFLALLAPRLTAGWWQVRLSARFASAGDGAQDATADRGQQDAGAREHHGRLCGGPRLVRLAAFSPPKRVDVASIGFF